MCLICAEHAHEELDEMCPEDNLDCLQRIREAIPPQKCPINCGVHACMPRTRQGWSNQLGEPVAQGYLGECDLVGWGNQHVLLLER